MSMRKDGLFLLISLFIVAFCLAAGQLPQKIISSVHIEGNRHTKSIVILREMLTKPGTILKREKIIQDSCRIKNLGLFSKVRVYPRELSPDSVEIIVEVKETRYWTPFPNIDWSEEKGWSFGAGIKFRNWRGMNQRLSFSFMLGGKDELKFSFRQPWTAGYPFTYGVTLKRETWERRHEEFTETDFFLQGNCGRRFTNDLKCRAIFGIWQIESDVAGKTISCKNRDRFLSVGGGINFDTRGSRKNPKYGQYDTLFVETDLGFDPLFYLITTSGDLRRYKPLAPNQVLALNLKWTLQFGAIPAYKRKYLGGIYSIRGWSFASFKCNNLLIASVEDRITMIETKPRSLWFIKNLNCGLAIVLFVDVAVAWGGSEAPFLPLYQGKGIGLAIFLPLINVLRLDYAYGERWQFHIYGGWRF